MCKAAAILLCLSAAAPRARACSAFDPATDDPCVRGVKAVWGIVLGGALLSNMVYSVKLASVELSGEQPTRNDGVGELVSVLSSAVVGAVTVGITAPTVY